MTTQLCTNVYIDRGSHTIKNIPIPIIYLCRYIHNVFSHSIIRNNKQCQLYYTHDDLMTILLLWMRGTFENELYYILYIYAYYIRVRYTHLYTYFFFTKYIIILSSLYAKVLRLLLLTRMEVGARSTIVYR